MDAQTLVNLRDVSKPEPFISNDLLVDWLRTESAEVLVAVQTGQIGKLWERLFWASESEDEEGDQETEIPLAEYLASGGRLDWFASMTRRAMMQHLIKMNGKVLHRFRLPAHDALRLYLAVDVTGRVHVKPGHCLVDAARVSVFVSTEDWPVISDVLGGADQDDAVGVILFRDVAAQQQVRAVIARNPNARGEYVLLQAEGFSADPESLPLLDSRDLPPRIDQVEREHSELQPGQVPDGDFWQQTQAVVEQARKYFLGLPKYVNVLAAYLLAHGDYPARLPARISDAIDGFVKDMADMDETMAWIEATAQELAKEPLCQEAQRRVRSVLRLSKDVPLRPAQGHWLDELTAMIKKHIAGYERVMDQFAARTMPPPAVLEAGAAWVTQGREFRRVYNTGVHAAMIRTRGRPEPQDFQGIAEECRRFLEQFPEADRGKVLLGAITVCYAEGPNDRGKLSDAGAWQAGKIANLTLRTLREIGVLVEPGEPDLRTLELEAVTCRRVTVSKPKLAPDKAPLLVGRNFVIVAKSAGSELVSTRTGNSLGRVDAEADGTLEIVAALASGDQLHAIVRPA
jgi:hypothetical protein